MRKLLILLAVLAGCSKPVPSSPPITPEELQSQIERSQASQRRLEAENAAREIARNRPQCNAINFAKVKIGMNAEQVLAILGPAQSILAETRTSVVYQWRQAEGIGNCNITFVDGEVVSKAQFGLE